MVNNNQSRRRCPLDARVMRIAQIPAATATVDCRRSAATWPFLGAPTTSRISTPVSKQATARANRENLLEGSKGDLAKTNASLFILHRLDNVLVSVWSRIMYPAGFVFSFGWCVRAFLSAVQLPRSLLPL